MATALACFPERSRATIDAKSSSRLAKFCDGRIWKLTAKDARSLGLKDLNSLQSSISVRAGRYGRAIRTSHLDDGIAIQVLSEEATVARRARRKIASALSEARRIYRVNAGEVGVDSPKPCKRSRQTTRKAASK